MQLHSAIIIALTLQLGSPDFRTREAATQALARLGAASLPFLEIAERSRDREVATRARAIIDRWYAANAERIAAGVIGERAPWICGDDGQAYLERARKQVGIQGPPDWSDYRLATKLMVEDMVRGRRPQVDMVRVLTGFRKDERDWIKAHGRNFDPPIK